MFDLNLRHLKDALLDPIASLLIGFSPNLLTLAGMAVGLVSALFSSFSSFYYFPLSLWLLNRLIDGLDGIVARKSKRQTDFGGYLDIVCDFTVYAAIPIGMALKDPSHIMFVSLSFLLGSFFVNAAGLFHLSAILEKRGIGSTARGEKTSVTMPPALIEGVETMIAYTLLFLFPSLTTAIFLIFSSLVIVTILQRLQWAARTL